MSQTLLKNVSKIIYPVILFVFCIQNGAFGQLHSSPVCASSTQYGLTWDSSPSASDEVNWSSPGAFSSTFTNVDNSGVDFTFDFTGDTGTLRDWNYGGGDDTPSVGTNASGGTEVLQYFTSGFNSAGTVTITITLSQPVTELGFDIYHVNGVGPNGDSYTITANTSIGGTIYPSFTSSPTPSYTTNTSGIINSTNNSTAGNNANVGVNFSDVNGITSITMIWDECAACTPGTAHGSAFSNFSFCAVPPPIVDNDNDGIADIDDIDDDNDGITDAQELCGTDPQGVSTSDVNISINLDNYPGETTWTLDSPSGQVASGGPYSTGNTTVSETVNVSENGSYTFTIFDSYGDGLLGNTYTLSGTDFTTITTAFNDQGLTGTQISQTETFSITSASSSAFSCLVDDPSADDDGDGILNYEDADFCTLNANGVCTSMDTDGDGIIDIFDLDSDGDGCYDAEEAGHGEIMEADNTIVASSADVGANGLDSSVEDNDTGTSGLNYTIEETNSGVYDFQSSSISSACGPPPDADNDGVADTDDLDDDNDGILDTDEGHCVFTTIIGNGTSHTETGGVTNPANSIGAPDGSYARLAGGDVLTVELSDLVPAGETIVLRITRDNNNGNMTVTSSPNNGTYGGSLTYNSGSGASLQTFEDVSYTVPSGGAKFIRFTRNNGRIRVDAVSYSVTCTPTDTDNDGTPDYLDPDSDNDGCPDAIEGGGNFTAADIENDTLTGGVDADGIPIVATASGQTVGTSADATQQDGACMTIAENDINQTPQDTDVSGNILTNDTDPTGDTQTVQSATGLDASGSPVTIPVNGTPTSIYDENGVLAGTIAINPDGSYDFDPAATFTGEVPVDYVVVDSNGATDTATLVIEVMPSNVPGQNDPPVANDDTNTTEQDVNVGGNVILPNDSDPDGDALTVSAALADTDGDGVVDDVLPVGTATTIYGTDDSGNTVVAGSMTLNSDGTYVFDPVPTFTGKIPVDYTISDGNGGTDDATLTITIEPDNGNATYANDDTSTGNQGDPQTGNVITNDNDPESNTQTVNSGTTSDGTPITPGTAVTLPSGGSLTLNPDGSYNYTPDPSFVGTEVVEYEVCDNGSPVACETATLYLTTLPINSIASKDDFNNTPYETPVSADVSTNDVDKEGDNQTFTLDGTNGGMDPADGTVTLNPDGSYTFTPANGFSGETSYQYSVCDDGTPALCDTATVFIEVLEPINTETAEVIANPDANTVEEGQTGTGNVLSNDLDPDGLLPAVTTPLVGQIVSGIDEDGNFVPNAGTLTLNTDGTYIFIPTPGFTGIVIQGYTICDPAIPAVSCDDTELIINVLPNEGNSTYANDDAAMTDVGIPVSGDVATNDTDSENDNQAISSYMYDTDGDGDADAAGTIGAPTQVGGTNDQGTYVANAGNLTLNSDGTYTFEPAAGFAGNVVVPYVTCDDVTPTPACEEATLVITVLDVKRDYGDAPAMYPAVWHRKMTDANSDQVLDGATDVWLGTQTSFEASQQSSSLADGDTNDDAIVFGMLPGNFPTTIAPSTNYDIDITVNSSVPDLVYYGLWIDWDNDGTYEDFYSGSQATASPATATETITSPAGILPGDEVNIRLRADDDPLSSTDYQGGKSNGEVEDYQSRPSVLPVKLSNFYVDENDCEVELNWETESEIDFDYFEIQWSGDGHEFTKIGLERNKGNVEGSSYVFTDKAPSEYNYYRLKMVDIDNSVEYSKVVYIKLDCKTLINQINLYPNPISPEQGMLNVEFYAPKSETQLAIVDLLGRTVTRLTLEVEKGMTNYIQVDISHLPAGTYSLQQVGTKTSNLFIIQE